MGMDRATCSAVFAGLLVGGELLDAGCRRWSCGFGVDEITVYELLRIHDIMVVTKDQVGSEGTGKYCVMDEG